jgi:CheY-like chemotaxis protein
MILVVEDDGPSRRAVTLALKTAGHEVMNAGDGTEALELLSIHHFELVITDLLRPNLNGQNLISTIRLKWPAMRKAINLPSKHLPGGQYWPRASITIMKKSPDSKIVNPNFRSASFLR